MVEQMIADHQADMKIEDIEGHLPIEYAIEYDRDELLKTYLVNNPV